MSADCPKCGAEMAVDYERIACLGEEPCDVCVCEVCGARFKVVFDGEYADGWNDCSGPGKELPKESPCPDRP